MSKAETQILAVSQHHGGCCWRGDEGWRSEPDQASQEEVCGRGTAKASFWGCGKESRSGRRRAGRLWETGRGVKSSCGWACAVGQGK